MSLCNPVSALKPAALLLAASRPSKNFVPSAASPFRSKRVPVSLCNPLSALKPAALLLSASRPSKKLLPSEANLF